MCKGPCTPVADTHAMNREHTVHALPVNAGTDLNRLDWDQIWSASPPSGSSTSKFQVNLDTSVGRRRLNPTPLLGSTGVSALETNV